MRTVLIVEDDGPMVWLLSKILSISYTVTTATSAPEAWCMLTSSERPDLIITDLSLPGMDGVELLENLKTSGIFKHIPVLVISGNMDVAVRERVLSLGAADFLLKPFDPEFLKAIVNELITENVEVHV